MCMRFLLQALELGKAKGAAEARRAQQAAESRAAAAEAELARLHSHVTTEAAELAELCRKQEAEAAGTEAAARRERQQLAAELAALKVTIWSLAVHPQWGCWQQHVLRADLSMCLWVAALTCAGAEGIAVSCTALLAVQLCHLSPHSHAVLLSTERPSGV